MNKGVEILLARMESNPDEFMGVNNKWVNLMDSYEDHMAEEDRKALYAKYSTLHMDKFTEHVMKKLLEEQQEKSNQFGEAYQQQYANAINAAQQRSAMMNQASALGIGSAGQIYMSNGAGSIQPVSLPTNSTTEVRIGKQTLTEKTIKKLKALLK